MDEELNIRKNVVIFGETGSGKSSVVNVIVGEKFAQVFDSAIGCTFEFSCFPFENYNLYDTVGLSEGSRGLVDFKNAISGLVKFLKSLKDGVNLLIFVMRKDRIKKTIEENYKLFVETIFMKKVPVILVVTHCETDKVMGEWWLKNKTHFDRYDMVFEECICVCSTKGEDMAPEFAPLLKSRYEVSHDNLIKSIEMHALSEGWRMINWLEWFIIVVKRVINQLRSLFNMVSIPYWPELKQRFVEAGIEEATAVELTNSIVYSID